VARYDQNVDPELEAGLEQFAELGFTTRRLRGCGRRERLRYAAPARANDLSGLPPAIIQVGELDVFRDEDIAYASGLLRAGVATELHVYPRAYHAFNVHAPEATVSRRMTADTLAALVRALHPDATATASAPAPASASTTSA
jgi:acetyl esterase/lipase